MSKPGRLLSLVLATVAFPIALSAQQFHVRPDTHAWGSYHWARTANPFTVRLQNNFTSAWSSFLSTASSDWTQSAVLNTTIVGGSSTTTTRRSCSMVLGRVTVCNYTYGNNGWLGLASININGSHITEGSVKINDTYFAQASYNNNSEKLHVVCQEVGHTFGLDHQSTSGASLNTCMDYYSNTSNSDTKSTHPNAHDYAELSTIYSHLDSTNTSFSVTPGLTTQSVASIPAMEQIELDGPGQWGTEVERSEDGRFSTFVLDFGSDRQIVTYVTWSDDATDADGNLRVRSVREHSVQP